MTQEIQLLNLGFVLLPALLTVYLLARWSNKASTSIYALARMVIQLILIGYLLSYIFQAERALMVMLVLAVMLIAAAWIALRPVAENARRLLLPAWLAISLVNISLLLLMTAGVLRADPWYQPNIVIPLAGMAFASGMNSLSLFVERFYAELAAGSTEIQARSAAVNATMIPTVNSLFAVGLVSLPGMMTGQILSGVSPLIAVRYQIMIMLMLFASAGLTVIAYHYLQRAFSGSDTDET